MLQHEHGRIQNTVGIKQEEKNTWDCQTGQGDVVEMRGQRGHPVGIANLR